ncbi:hypothetical protein HZY83_04640 [Gemella sp. GH3]|uniref:heme-binding Shp domain-containing protein n=1 Tax=unclassified Gemella TaxID=2624949 RepID=UPI0015D03AA6|nr:MULTISPECIES: heme-binding Shp domain-containing protein [unclassified Gemella]MBF0713969.1 hypothetical protein [Gemella sp. GH3.1]NYS50921.1 hypothetical protein [Gemella sp. GH3]
MKRIFLAVIIILSFIGQGIVYDKKITYAQSKVYHVPVSLWHAENSGRLSMGSRAVSSIARVEENGGMSTVTVEFVPMEFMDMNGHLIGLSVYSVPLFSGGLTRATVVGTYQDVDLDGNIATFPSLLQFTRSTLKEDKIGVQVTVDAMNKVMGGDASQNAILKFNWSGASLISGSEEQSDNSTQTENKDSEKASSENKNDAQEKDSNDENKNGDKKEVTTKKVEDYFRDDTKTNQQGVYNLDITASYLNPLTGVTADGGSQNVDIGEGMSQGVISPVNDASTLDQALNNQKSSGEKRWSKAQLQRTSDGKLYATVRIHLINWVTRNNEQGPFIKVLQSNGEYKLVEAVETNVHLEKYKDSYADYRFEVPRENFSAMIQMFVEPMNRPVRFFVEVNSDSIAKGSVDGMQIIDEKKSNNKIYYIITSLFTILIVGVGVYIIRKRTHKVDKDEK